jgi:hypothetical protein
MLSRLDEHQAGIRAILNDAESMLTDPVRRDIAGLARARWALLRELTAYQLFKHGKLLDPFIRSGAPARVVRAERLKQAGIAAVEAFRGNVTRWSATDVAAVWPVYQPSALAMIARLRGQVAQDREQIGALLG